MTARSAIQVLISFAQRVELYGHYDLLARFLELQEFEAARTLCAKIRNEDYQLIRPDVDGIGSHKLQKNLVDLRMLEMRIAVVAARADIDSEVETTAC